MGETTFSEEELAKSYTAEALAKLVDDLFEHDIAIATYESQIKEIKALRDEKDQHIHRILDVLELTQVSGKRGTYKIEEKVAGVKMPVGDARDEFVNWMKAQVDESGINWWDSMATIHSATLRSFYKRQLEQAKSEGEMSIEMPGIEPPKTFFKGRWK